MTPKEIVTMRFLAPLIPVILVVSGLGTHAQGTLKHGNWEVTLDPSGVSPSPL